MNNPNSFDDVMPVDANANPPDAPEGTDPIPDTPGGIDYEVKFKESSKEAQRLLQANKEKDEIIEALKRQNESNPPTPTSPPIIPTPDDADDTELFPGFSELDPDAQRNVQALVGTTARLAKQEVMNDPAIAHSRKVYNETKWREGFDAVTSAYPDLAAHADEFKAKYYNPSNVPDNIQDVLLDLAKIYLFDKAKDIGAEEERRRANQIDLEDVTGGDHTPAANRTLEDWQHLAATDPAKFASLSKEYNEDVAAGRI